MSGDIELVEHNRSWKWAPMNDPKIIGYVNWCFCAACLVPGICGNGKCEVVQNGTLVSSFKCVCDPGYANILNMTAGYCANQCKFVLSGFMLIWVFTTHITSLHSKLCKIVPLVWLYTDNMDGLSVTNDFALVATPSWARLMWTTMSSCPFMDCLTLPCHRDVSVTTRSGQVMARSSNVDDNAPPPIQLATVIGEIFGHNRLRS